MSDSVRFRLPALTRSVTLDAFEAWLVAAIPGARFDYADGPALPAPGRDATVDAVRAAIDSGTVLALPQRRGDDGRIVYSVERADPQAERRAVRSAQVPALPKRTERLLAFLMERTLLGPTIASDAAIGQHLGLTRRQVQYEMERLTEAGLITIHQPANRRDPRCCRVTGSACGAQSGGRR